MNSRRPQIAIIDPNTLSALGLKQLLQNVIPIITVDTFGSFAELSANHPEAYIHYFVAMSIVLEHKAFFVSHRRKTIVLTTNLSPLSAHLSEFHSLCTNVPEQQLVRSLLTLEQYAHGHGQHLPPMPAILQQKILTNREIEIMSLIAQGYTSKEMAAHLCISINTVTTHRKNIMDKLGMKSVSALTIYAVMHGYVDINKI